MPLKTKILRGEVRSPVYGPLASKWGVSEEDVVTGPGASTGGSQGLLLILTKD